MYNQALNDNQQVIVHGNPRTTASRPANSFSFQVSADDDTTNLLELTVINGGPSDPQFKVRPRFSFFGPPRTITLTMSGQNDAAAPRKSTQMTVTVTGTVPDDGTLDHFEPSGETPTNQ